MIFAADFKALGDIRQLKYTVLKKSRDANLIASLLCLCIRFDRINLVRFFYVFS